MENTENPAVYFASLTLENLKCFQGKHDINLSTSEGKPAMWTVILGNNNTGKTTILRALASLEAKKKDKKESFSANYFMYALFGTCSATLLLMSKEEYKYVDFWGYTVDEPISFSMFSNEKLGNFLIYGYGVTRKPNAYGAITPDQENNHTASLFTHDTSSLINFEEWILQLYLASKNGVPKAQTQINRLKAILGGKKILPDVIDFEVVSEITDTAIKNYILFHTDFGKVRLQDLGYGYQSMLSWLVDFMYRMFLRYPESENPLAEPAIVLLDEIDLHLHPDWQRKIIGFLSDIFKKTQFIVTTHSPLILQSAENINVVMLTKNEQGNGIVVRPSLKRTDFRGWTIEEILSSLMEMENKTLSEKHKQLLNDFTESLEQKQYDKTQQVFKELSELLHSNNEERQILQFQMSSIPRKK